MCPTDGLEVRLVSHVASAIEKIDDAQEERATRAGIRAHRAVVEKLTGEGRGREYTVPGTNVTYTASAPGDPPAQRTGTLRGSIAYEVRSFLGGYEAVVGSPEKYAPMLEFGTYRMEPRPFVRPALAEIQGELRRIIGGRWF